MIGNAETVLEIINDFENNEKLGFIFPETYYEIIYGLKGFENINLALHITNKNNINYILKQIFHKYQVGEKIIFPAGNMFWARTKAIYQIFKININFPDELNQVISTNLLMEDINNKLIICLIINNDFNYILKNIYKNNKK